MFECLFAKHAEMIAPQITVRKHEWGMLAALFDDNEVYGMRCGKTVADAVGNWDKQHNLAVNTQQAAHPFWLALTGQLATNAPPVRLVFIGTIFQLSVWRQLAHLPPHHCTSYQQLAIAINNPRAVRAVGKTIGLNPFFYLNPCHRVLYANTTISGFAYGTLLKKTMLRHEQITWKE